VNARPSTMLDAIAVAGTAQAAADMTRKIPDRANA
jgi:hypothetical protein